MRLICHDLLSWYPLQSLQNNNNDDNDNIGIIRIFIFLSFFLSFFLIYYKLKQTKKQLNSSLNSSYSLFPHFIRLLIIIFIFNLITLSILLFLNYEVIQIDNTKQQEQQQQEEEEKEKESNYNYNYNDNNNEDNDDSNDNNNVIIIEKILYCLSLALQHTITESIAFLLIQKGCGYYAFYKTRNFSLIWLIFSFLYFYFIYSNNMILNIIGWLMWLIGLIFYFLLWLLPSKYLFRRAAVRPYAKFWAIYRFLLLISYILVMIHSHISSSPPYGYCGIVIIGYFGYAFFQPLIIYWTLLEDSRWWQGIMDPPSPNNSRNNSQTDSCDVVNTSITDMRTPLLGVDLSFITAISLAGAVDRIGANTTVNILNFAHIQLTSQRNLLGRGSFSKVYRGVYKKEPCAVKLIFTTDLTEEVISRVIAEATLLSAVQSPNIVKIIGISVLPPSVCMVLELCTYGSLSDILRGSDSGSGKIPFQLTERDQIFLALGCARGVAALHSLSSKVVHRDIKSFNFLVDSQFNTKLADLELGVTSFKNDQPNQNDFRLRGPTVDDFLVNWIAPEVLRGEEFSQASDIYSLALVFYEILTRLIPYEDLPLMRDTHRETIKDMVMKGYRPPISLTLFTNSHFLSLIERSWSPYPHLRPSALDISLEIEEIWFSLLPSLNPPLYNETKISRSLTSYYHKLHKFNRSSQPLTSSLSLPSNQSISQPSIFATTQLQNMNPITQSISANSNTTTIATSTLSTTNTTSINKLENSILDDKTKHSSLPFNSLSDIYNQIHSSIGLNNSIGNYINSPWNAITNSTEPIIIISTSVPHIIVHTSQSFLTNILKVPSDQRANVSWSLFGSSIQSLSSLSLQQNNCNYHNNNQEIHQPHQIIQKFFSTIQIKGSGQMVQTIYDNEKQPLTCLFHGYPIYHYDPSHSDHNNNVNNLNNNNATRPTIISQSYSDPPLSSVSLSTNNSNEILPFIIQETIMNTTTTTPSVLPINSMNPIKSTLPLHSRVPLRSDAQKSGELLYYLLTVSPLRPILNSTVSSSGKSQPTQHSSPSEGQNRTNSFASFSNIFTRQSNNSLSSHGISDKSITSHHTPVNNSHQNTTSNKSRKRSDSSFSQNIFLLYDTERYLSVDDGLFDQEDPFEGSRDISSTSISYRPSELNLSYTELLNNHSQPSFDQYRTSQDNKEEILHDL